MTDRRGPPTVTRPRPVVTLLLAVVVVSAGCGAVPVDTPRSTPAGTLTPAPVPSVGQGTVEHGAFPPGVAPNGSFDADRLARAHAGALAGNSYTETLARTVTVAGVPTVVRQSLRRVAVDGNATLVERSGTRLVPRSAVYSDRSGTYLRTERRDRVRVAELNGSPRIPTPEGTVSHFLAGLNVTATPVAVRGARFYRLVGRSAGPTRQVETPRGRTAVTNYTARALVAPSGFLRRLTVSYRLTEDGRRLRVRVTVEYTRLGTTNVSRPPWVPASGNTSDDRSRPS